MIDGFELLTPTPLDTPVTWAMDPAYDPQWRTRRVDRFLRWRLEHAAWCQEGRVMGDVSMSHPFHIPVRVTWTPCPAPAVYTGHLIAFHPEGFGLVREPSRMLVLLPLDAVRPVE